MTEDQYILAVRGTLDRQSAAVLSREMESLIGRGYRRIVLSGERLGPVLPEGVMELQRWARQYAEARSENPANLPKVAVHSLKGPASAQFLLHGVPVTERRVQILPPVDEGDLPVGPESPDGATANAEDMSGWMVHCPACHHPSRVKQPGDYACPVCSAHFRMTATGALPALLPE